MSAPPMPRVKVPSPAKKGELIQIKTLISHPMESGRRKDPSGNIVPRKIINRFTATFNGNPVLEIDLEPAIAENPYQTFYFKAQESGTFVFTWRDDDGSEYVAEGVLEVK